MSYFLKKIRFVKFKDLLSFFFFILALPISWVYRLKRKNLWLICERADEARDNGYWFYKYMCEHHPEVDCVYAIKSKSADFAKIKKINKKTIEFGSLKHWIYYLTADINISSQKEGKPNAAVCHFLEVYGILKNRRVYLKHGIVVNDLKWHYFAVTKMWMYVCSAKQEMEYCQKKFGYPEGSVKLTGLCRFDNLNNDFLDKKTVFIMPTSREWIAHPIKEYQKYDDIYHFENTEYFKAWSEFLTNQTFNKCIEDHHLNVVFFLHPTMQSRFASYFTNLNTKAKIECNADVDLQYMLKKAGVLITDYSSIFMDFAYMGKPELFFQFDYDKFREGHYQEGYFSYENNGFGKVCKSAQELAENLKAIVDNDCKTPDLYVKRANNFFAYHDSLNCERTYKAIIEQRANNNKKV